MPAPIIILPEIEAFLRATGTTASYFGRHAVRDPRLVFDLRNGRNPRPRTADRVRAYIERAA